MLGFSMSENFFSFMFKWKMCRFYHRSIIRTATCFMVYVADFMNYHFHLLLSFQQLLIYLLWYLRKWGRRMWQGLHVARSLNYLRLVLSRKRAGHDVPVWQGALPRPEVPEGCEMGGQHNPDPVDSGIQWGSSGDPAGKETSEVPIFCFLPG